MWICTENSPSSSWSSILTAQQCFLKQPPPRVAGKGLRNCDPLVHSYGWYLSIPEQANFIHGQSFISVTNKNQTCASHPSPEQETFLPGCGCRALSMGAVSVAYLRQENVPNSAPAAMPTAKPIMKPIFTLSKQLGCDCPYGPTVTGI